MSYDTTLKRYNTTLSAFKSAVTQLANSGVNVDEINRRLEEGGDDKHKDTLSIVQNRNKFMSLTKMAQELSDIYTCLSYAPIEDGYDSDTNNDSDNENGAPLSHYPGWSDGGMYQGFDNWCDYCNACGIDERNDD